jgi:hypothetical protein
MSNIAAVKEELCNNCLAKQSAAYHPRPGYLVIISRSMANTGSRLNRVRRMSEPQTAHRPPKVELDGGPALR